MSSSSDGRVVVFAPRLLPGSETFILDQALALKRWRALLLGLRRTEGLSLATLEHHVVAAKRDAASAWSALQFLFGRSGAELSARLHRERPRLFHAHFLTGGAMLLPLAQRCLLPLVVTAHGADVGVSGGMQWGQILLRRRWKALVRQVQCFVAVSGPIAQKLVARGVPDSRVVVQHIGVTLERPWMLDPADRLGDQVLFVGRLVEKKGLDVLLAALAGMGRCPRLVVVGDGPRRRDWEKLASRLAVPAVFLGQQPREEVAALMLKSTVLCVPSRTARSGDMEGLPIVCLEGLAAGIPVVATRHSGIPEAITHGVSGILVPEDDRMALRAALESLFRDSDLRHKLAIEGRRTVERDFDLSTCTRQLEAIYDRFAGRA